MRRQDSITKTKIKEVRETTTRQVKKYYLQCLHQLVNDQVRETVVPLIHSSAVRAGRPEKQLGREDVILEHLRLHWGALIGM